MSGSVDFITFVHVLLPMSPFFFLVYHNDRIAKYLFPLPEDVMWKKRYAKSELEHCEVSLEQEQNKKTRN